MADDLLRVEKLCKRFTVERSLLGRLRDWWLGRPPRFVQALRDVSFDIGRGEIVGFLGESGSGKSTLARVLMGIHPRDAGSATFSGKPLFDVSESERLALLRRMQMIFQDPFGSLDPRMTVRDILLEPLAVHGIGSRTERKEILERNLSDVGLGTDVLERYPAEFSGGQRQRICISRALVTDPALLIADEAVSALDVSVQAQILDLLLALKRKRNLAILFISHDVAVVRQFCDRVFVLYRGRIVEELEPTCLLGDPVHAYTRKLVAASLEIREGRTLQERPVPTGQKQTGPGEGSMIEIHPGHRFLKETES